MAKTTVFGLVRYLLSNSEFYAGGIAEKEDNYIKRIGMTDDEEHRFFEAMYTILELHRKHKGEW